MFQSWCAMITAIIFCMVCDDESSMQHKVEHEVGQNVVLPLPPLRKDMAFKQSLHKVFHQQPVRLSVDVARLVRGGLHCLHRLLRRCRCFLRTHSLHGLHRRFHNGLHCLIFCIQFSHNYRQRQQRLLLQCSAYFCLHGKGFSDICRYSTSVSTNLNRLKPSLWRRFPFPCCTRLQEKVRRSISRVTSALTEDKMTNCIPLATTNTTPRYVPSFENCRTIGLWNKSSKSRAVTSQLYPT